MAFTPSPPSVNSNFSLSDSVSDIATLDMTDIFAKPDPHKVPEFPVFKEEGSLNSSMITVIVSLSRHTCCTLLYGHFLLQVDDIHFRLDSHFLLRESDTLKAIITASETDSIRLQNVSAVEFRALWRFFYEG